MRWRSALFLAISFTSVACEPTCKDSCQKALSCDAGGSRVALSECRTSCLTQEALYDEWEDEVKQDALSAHMRCIRGSTCDEILDGVCYDEDVFLFESQ
ncbi:MAG: hypothetical protein ACI9MC_001885 [Kiritimatiellia bacterium]|jgi:hypothetical protein